MAKRKHNFFERLGLIALFCLFFLGITFLLSPSNSKEQELSAKEESQLIYDLTKKKVVVDYLVNNNQRLPDYYIRKAAAQQQGWDARAGNLCDILPGRAIGGDRFGNLEKRLPERAGRVWYEADINYRCGHRGGSRVVYSNDGLIYVTTNHYNSFKVIRGEE